MIRINEKIVIGVAMHNNSNDIRRCLKSILIQENLKRNIHIVIGNDNSTDDWEIVLNDFLNNHKTKITVLNLNNSNVVKTRNAINDYILKEIESVVLIGRLDADDEFSDEKVLSKIEVIFDKQFSDLILAGNYLRTNEGIIERVNRSTKSLLNKNYLKKRVFEMSNGISTSELPSCNLFIKPSCLFPYPEIESGEDHFLLVNYITNKKRFHWYFAEDLLAVIYSLEGATTLNNINKSSYFSSRKRIYDTIIE